MMLVVWHYHGESNLGRVAPELHEGSAKLIYFNKTPGEQHTRQALRVSKTTAPRHLIRVFAFQDSTCQPITYTHARCRATFRFEHIGASHGHLGSSFRRDPALQEPSESASASTNHTMMTGDLFFLCIPSAVAEKRMATRSFPRLLAQLIRKGGVHYFSRKLREDVTEGADLLLLCDWKPQTYSIGSNTGVGNAYAATCGWSSADTAAYAVAATTPVFGRRI
ncbi:hypothetical protein FB567DRAFT_263367 [Paraphoma chrysanthemicola]|uniref:Uncharacterized protein n=1 Tax=Paraphoma chrysanthemicola TaxID=798071 RepID=A0A8K0RAW9_9PLEO|nr:hypothetical protein FB567DRAFT_263367 [Paraphoma chrysanthemicola]